MRLSRDMYHSLREQIEYSNWKDSCKMSANDNLLEKIEPTEVFGFFGEILKRPHPSGNEVALSKYLIDFAKERELEAYCDSEYNVIIKKAATKGMENRAGVILQAHIDMVAIADKDVNIDFNKDSIEAIVDGDFVRANGTTLGADDGIGAAMILAVLDSKTISHPAIEAIFTTNEEVGLDGAKALDTSLLQSRRMINLDSEDENELVIGCAGGSRAYITYKCSNQISTGDVYEICLDGLKGGHSGIEINKNHPNANVLMGRILCELSGKIELGLSILEGGIRDNAITTSCIAEIVTKNDCDNELNKFISELEVCLKREYQVSEPDLSLSVKKISKENTKVISRDDFNKIIYLLNMAPNGVLKMSQQVEGMVDTSCNLGILRLNDESFSASFSLRSNQDSSRLWLEERFKLLAKSLGADVRIDGEYPAWENAGVSDFAKNIAKEYKNITGNEMNVLCIHAGLECALFYKKIKDLDAVSIGPKINGVHTTSEAVSIKSVGVIWELLKNILAD